MKRYEIVVFCTGAVILSLELIASRIMTPYFGVSLYIWTGILAITLIFLGLGYGLGGKFTRAKISGPELELGFLSAPILAALAIVLSAAVYPALFPIFSRVHLIVGSFVAAGLLLAIPLILLSALNPILIAMQRHAASADGSDGGAGRIFFISTIGSVCGVLFTAFLFIPYISNYRAILILAILLCLLVVAFTRFAAGAPASAKWKLNIASLLVIVLCAALLIGRDGYLRLITSSENDQLTFKIVAEYTSLFGNIKVAEVRRRDGGGPTERYFIQDGVIQGQTAMNNQSQAMYTYALELLARSHAPKARSAVVFGLGAGTVSRKLVRNGLKVSVVEINPDALAAAVTHFGFPASDVDMHLQDARTFARECKTSYDIAIVDLAQDDSVPDYLRAKEFFADLKRCLHPDGILLMNTFLDTRNDEPNGRLFATIASAFPVLYLSGERKGNSFIVGKSLARAGEPIVDQGGVPEAVAPLVRMALTEGRRLWPDDYDRWAPVSDDHNTFSVLFADADMVDRSLVVGFVPPRLLVN